MKTASLDAPGSHYCNTLQSPILQIAIYLYCRVQLTDCSILKGVGQIRHSSPQGAHRPANLLAPDSLKSS